MPIGYTAGGDLSTGGSRLSEPGTYHLVVIESTEVPQKKGGGPVLNAAFAVTVGVLAGTTPNQRDKTVNIIFFNGKAGEAKSEAFAKKKMDRFFLATGLLTQQQIETKATVQIDIKQADGRQFIAKFDKEKPEDRFVDLSFADIYHVDDPAVKDVPKDLESIKTIRAALRWPGGVAPGATPAKAPTAPTPAPPQPSTSFDDTDV